MLSPVISVGDVLTSYNKGIYIKLEYPIGTELQILNWVMYKLILRKPTNPLSKLATQFRRSLFTIHTIHNQATATEDVTSI